MSLDAAWHRALTLAWASFLNGTTPVGAVVIGPDGTMAAEGRGRRYEQLDGTGYQLANSHIAHAEINALAGCDPYGGASRLQIDTPQAQACTRRAAGRDPGHLPPGGKTGGGKPIRPAAPRRRGC